MLRQLLNWRTALAIVAILIVSGTIIYSQYLAGKIAKDERKKVEQWAKASRFILNASPDTDIEIVMMIVFDNTTIPIIETNERDSIIDHKNLDSVKALNPQYVEKKLKQ